MTLKMSIQHYLVWLSMHDLECHLQSQACSVSDSLQEPWKDSGWSRICSLPWRDSLQSLLLSKSTYSLLPTLGAVPVPCSWMVNCNCILKRLRRKKKSSKVWRSTSSAETCLLLDRQVTCPLEIHFALSQLMAPSSSAVRFLGQNLQVLWVRNDCRHGLPKANLGVAEHWAKAWLSAQHADVRVLLPELCEMLWDRFEISISTYTAHRQRSTAQVVLKLQILHIPLMKGKSWVTVAGLYLPKWKKESSWHWGCERTIFSKGISEGVGGSNGLKNLDLSKLLSLNFLTLQGTSHAAKTVWIYSVLLSISLCFLWWKLHVKSS